MLKGEDRLKEKISEELTAKSYLTVAQAMSVVPDPIRFSLCYPGERYADGVTTDVNRIKSEWFELTRLKNLWHSDQYKGINSQWRDPATGTRTEMQFHTSVSIEAKELTHEAYERIRSRTVDPVEREDLQDFQRRANAPVVTPAGTNSRDLTWVFSPLPYEAEHGDITNDFTKISEAEADQIVARIRANAPYE
jgi:hypothetical protein